MILTKDSREFLVLAIRYDDRHYFPTVITLKRVALVALDTGRKTGRSQIDRKVHVLSPQDALAVCRRNLRNFATSRQGSGYKVVAIDVCRGALQVPEASEAPYYGLTPLGTQDAAVVAAEEKKRNLRRKLAEKKALAEEGRKAAEEEMKRLEAERKRAEEHAARIARLEAERPAEATGSLEQALYATSREARANRSRRMVERAQENTQGTPLNPAPLPPRGLEDVRPQEDPNEDATTTRARMLELD